MKHTNTILLYLALLAPAVNAWTQQHSRQAIENLLKKYPQGKAGFCYSNHSSRSADLPATLTRSFFLSRSQMTTADIALLREAFYQDLHEAPLDRREVATHERADSSRCTLIIQAYGPLKPGINGPTIGSVRLAVGRWVKVDVEIPLTEKEANAAPLSLDEMECTFTDLAKTLDAKKQAVAYTGCNGQFILQYDAGRGWTTGTRYTATGAKTRQVYERLQSLFEKHLVCPDEDIRIDMEFDHKQGVYRLLLGSYAQKRFYLCTYDPKGTLFLLSAKTEQDVCIPMNWEHIDRYNNRVVEPAGVANAYPSVASDRRTEAERQRLLRQMDELKKRLE